MLCGICVSDVSFPSEQFTLPAEPVAANGGAGAVRQGIRATSVRDVHTWSQQGVHHVETGLCCDCPQVNTANVLCSPTRKLRCCGAQLLRNFRVFTQPRNCCHVAQLSRNSGRFRAVLAPIIFHLREIWEQIGPLITRNLSFPKFVAVCPKIATSCLHTYFHSRCHCARVARLMTLQHSLQYRLSLSWTGTLFPKISNFCTSVGLYNIGIRYFVVRCQDLPKYQSTKGPK